MDANPTPGETGARGRRARIWFPAVVFGALAVALLLEHSRPSPADLPRFAPPEEVVLEEIAIPRGDHVLEGRLLLADGEPAARVLVELLRDDEPRWAYSDDEGRFRIEGVGEGRAEVALVLPGHRPVVQVVDVPARPVEWILPEAWPVPEALPEVRRSALYGTVSSPLGASVGGAELVLVPEPASGVEESPLSGRIPRRVPIGGGGNFNVVDLVVGRYRAWVLPEWAAGGSWPRLAELVLEHGSEVRDLDVLLESGEIRGQLLDREGSPVPRVLVSVVSAARPDRLWPPVRSDADGSFAVGDLPSGEYDVTVRAGSADRTRRVSVRARRVSQAEFGPVNAGDADDAGGAGRDPDPGE
jgi:hypothetical protein